MPLVRSIKVEMLVHLTTMQDVKAGQDEVAAARNFVEDLQKAAAARLPDGRYKLLITETRETMQQFHGQ